MTIFRSRPRPIRRAFLLSAIIRGEKEYVQVRATSEASARIKAAHTFNCKYGTELTPFELRLE